jgi:gamma-glutamyl-gamma-aminobutyraldehyde dehydrogenase
MQPGDPLRLDTQIGAINSAAQLTQNLKAIEIAQSEGSEIVFGGTRSLPETGGFYMGPTIVNRVKPEHSLFQKEVFGPVLSITSFEDQETAIELANGTDYGLAAGVWTSSLSRAHQMVRALKCGVVHVNTYGGPDITVPLGGVGQSGNGSDKSLHAISKYQNLKTAWMQL